MNVRPLKPLAVAAAFAALGASALPAAAADWSDTSLSWRYGSAFREPFDNTATGGKLNVAKNIFAITHVSGYKYGINFLNVDLLESNSKDPANCSNFVCTGSAQEAYVVYRNTVELSKVTGKDYKWGVVRDWGGTFGFDWNTKTDAGYSSKKRMLVAGPTMEFDVPGALSLSLLALWESNAPCSTFPPGGCVSRYSYKTHPALSLSGSMPIGSSGFNVQGYGLIIGKKGNNEFGGPTATETHFDVALMYDVGAAVGGPKQTFKIGFEYEYWKNKFGNSYKGAAGPGAYAKTPMIRAEYHF